MNESEHIIEELNTNGIMTIRPVGGSMRGRIETIMQAWSQRRGGVLRLQRKQ